MTTSYAWAEKKKSGIFSLKVAPLSVPAPSMISSHNQPKFSITKDISIPYITLQEICRSTSPSINSDTSKDVVESSFSIPGTVEQETTDDCVPIIRCSDVDSNDFPGESFLRTASTRIRNSPIMTLVPSSPRSPRSETPDRKNEIKVVSPGSPVMWSSVTVNSSSGAGTDVPNARHKHAMCCSIPTVYLLGGRHGNFPLKDFWCYDLVSRSWQEIRDDHGSRPPSLQQHTMVASMGKLIVFGGELCMSNETPLWIYETKTKTWRKWKKPQVTSSSGLRSAPGPPSAPTGRRGHSAVMAGNKMIIYGGFQDLHGSSNEMWSFNVESEVWQKVCVRGEEPPGRHAHTAVYYDGYMWVYGGMTDLQERNDLWKFDFETRTWFIVRARQGPGCLHSHVATVLRGVMVVFGGERQGELLDELWRFHFSTLIWERLMPSGPKPQPRSQFCAFVAPSHGVKSSRYNSAHSTLGSASTVSTGGSSYTSGYSSGGSTHQDGYRSRRHDGKGGNGSGGNGGLSRMGVTILDRDLSCPCHDIDAPLCEEDELDPHRLKALIQKNCVNQNGGNLKSSISKISQLNLSHLNRYYSYSMLSNDSSESIVDDSLSSTCDSLGSKLTKSQSIHAIKDKNSKLIELENKMAMSRDILSVPNFGDLIDIEDDIKCNNIPLNKIRQDKLVNISTSDEELEDEVGEELKHSIHGRLAFKENIDKSSDTNFSDHLMSFSCNQSSVGSESNIESENHYSGLNSFSNPNYIAYDNKFHRDGLLNKDYWRKGALDLETVRHKQYAEILKTPPHNDGGVSVEMERKGANGTKVLDDIVNLENGKAAFKKPFNNHTVYPVINIPDTSNGDSNQKGGTGTSRVTFGETSDSKPTPAQRCTRNHPGGILTSARINPFLRVDPVAELQGPELMYIVGGKETGHFTGKRPLSVWKLDFPF